jgi:glucuronate isomerase
MDENFLLENDVSVKLYHGFAKDMPIYDFHCHLNPVKFTKTSRLKTSPKCGSGATITNGVL